MGVLHEVPVGSVAIVEGITSEGVLRERMLSLGITKGVNIDVIRRGPSGDPTLYNIRGAMIALRKEEASMINVKLD